MPAAHRGSIACSALLGEFGERSPIGEVIVACRVHIAKIASVTTAVTLRRIEGHVFANREDLRKYVLAEFSSVEHPYRVVVVDGKERTGKTYLWNFIRYAAHSLSADPVLINLEEEGDRLSAPELLARIVDQASHATSVDRTVDPTATPDQQARSLVNKLVGWHKRGQSRLEKPSWIVIDHLDKIWPPADPGLAPFIQHLVLAWSRRQAEGLRLILLGVPSEAIGVLEAELERRVVDPLTPGDLTEWLRDELVDLGIAMADLDGEARAIHSDGPLLLHKRLAARCQKIRTDHGAR